jgi:hypothetical protein
MISIIRFLWPKQVIVERWGGWLWKKSLCYIGNKDTSAVYPKSLHVNKQNVLKALLWLKKHNPHYADITINELNLDWMNGKNEANIGTQASILKTKDTHLQD